MATAERQVTRPPVRIGRIAGRTVLYVALGVIAVVMIAPFAWMVLTSLKTPADIASSVPPCTPATASSSPSGTPC
ncbi:hypothetical protein [Actinocatenispora rupis]|uniref:Multiple sugar transport system permease protein n=1 Tax=Actinocatenispora rupis TaxID=519421 RepID=A0A8J3J3H3_9ACTN|nr:hypothetical protein [Actinocatenispora rupis]GID11410.1 hypothetical protein Aru02nite_22990 [Actinocatenispora rupis]